MADVQHAELEPATRFRATLRLGLCVLQGKDEALSVPLTERAVLSATVGVDIALS